VSGLAAARLNGAHAPAIPLIRGELLQQKCVQSLFMRWSEGGIPQYSPFGALVFFYVAEQRGDQRKCLRFPRIACQLTITLAARIGAIASSPRHILGANLPLCQTGRPFGSIARDRLQYDAK
jgi:hypothetical protein